METSSDLRKGTGKGASQKAVIACYWGSPNDSKLAGRISVEWPKGSEKPTVYCTIGEKENLLPVEQVDVIQYVSQGPASQSKEA